MILFRFFHAFEDIIRIYNCKYAINFASTIPPLMVNSYFSIPKGMFAARNEPFYRERKEKASNENINLIFNYHKFTKAKEILLSVESTLFQCEKRCYLLLFSVHLYYTINITIYIYIIFQVNYIPIFRLTSFITDKMIWC